MFRQELDELWCLLTWFTWTIVNTYWFIGPLQSLVLKEHQCLLDIQYSPQGIDESLKWSEFVHFNSWLWQSKTHGHNATHAERESVWNFITIELNLFLRCEQKYNYGDLLLRTLHLYNLFKISHKRYLRWTIPIVYLLPAYCSLDQITLKRNCTQYFPMSPANVAVQNRLISGNAFLQTSVSFFQLENIEFNLDLLLFSWFSFKYAHEIYTTRKVYCHQ